MTGSPISPVQPVGGATAFARRRLLGASGAALAWAFLRTAREAAVAKSATPEATPVAAQPGVDAACLAASRTGEQPGPGPAGAPARRWRVSIGAGFAPPPVLGGDAVFVADNDGAFRALDAATGQERWRAPLGGGATGAAVVGTTVLTGGDALVARDTATGDERWRLGPAMAVTAPVACGELAYAGGARGVFAIEVATGAERWRFLTGTAMGAPAASGDAVAVRSGDGVLYVLDAATGRERWSVGTGGGPLPVLAGGAVVVGAERGALGGRHGTLTVFDLGAGGERWRVELSAGVTGAPTPSGPLATPALAGETVYLAAGSGGPVDGSGSLVALDAATGAVRWRHVLPHVLVSPPVVANGVAYVSSADPYLGGVLVAVGGS
jgi:outer membrane protein assembly factor BamB